MNPSELIEAKDASSYSWNVGVSTGHLLCEIVPNLDHTGLVKACEHMTLALRGVKDFSEQAFLIGVGYAFASMIGVPSIDGDSYATTKTIAPDMTASTVNAMLGRVEQPEEALPETSYETQSSEAINVTPAKGTKKLRTADWQVPA